MIGMFPITADDLSDDELTRLKSENAHLYRLVWCLLQLGGAAFVPPALWNAAKPEKIGCYLDESAATYYVDDLIDRADIDALVEQTQADMCGPQEGC